MSLWLLRHGHAEAQARTDAERPLSERGRREARLIAAAWRGPAPGRLLVSPYLRAQQTAQIFSEQLGWRVSPETVDWVTPESSVTAAAGQLEACADGVCLLVAHNPLLERLASLLLHGHLQGATLLGTAHLLWLEGEYCLPGLLQLRGHYRPE